MVAGTIQFIPIYYFTDQNSFTAMISTGIFAEYDRYTYDRLYGSLKSDYIEGNKVVVLTLLVQFNLFLSM